MSGPDGPNNFPAEGDHSVVTAAGVQELEDHRPDPLATLDYTIGGSVETEVHTTHEAAREYAINRGHRILNQAANTFEHEVETAAHKPMSIDFNAVKEEARAHLERRAQVQSQEQVETP